MVTHAPANKGAEPPQFSAHYYCGQTVARIKMPLGTEVSFGLHDIVLDGNPAPLHKKRAEPRPLRFSTHVYCGQTAGWIKMVVSIDVGLSPGDFMLDGDPAPSQKGSGAPPIFGAFLLWPNG